jgi:hypothetical protein
MAGSIAFLVSAVWLFLASAAPAAADPYGPYPKECRVAPRTMDELRALAAAPPAIATPLLTEATPGGAPAMRTVPLPDGPRPDAATVAAIRDVGRQRAACFNAFDMLRWFAVFSDDMIRRDVSLQRIAIALVAGDLPAAGPEINPSEWHNFPGLFHPRELPDGRVAAVAPLGNLGLLELHIFVRDGEVWRLDEVAYLDETHTSSGITTNTLTLATMMLDVDSGQSGYGYGFGVEFDPSWHPLSEWQVGTTWGAALTNGTSIVVFGAPFRDQESGYPKSAVADCLPALTGNSRADMRSLGLNRKYVEQTAGLVPARAPDGSLLSGNDGLRAHAVYEIGYRADGAESAAEPYRLYIECRAMSDGEWVLGIAQLVPAAAYDGEVAAREQLLATIDG